MQNIYTYDYVIYWEICLQIYALNQIADQASHTKLNKASVMKHQI